MYVRFFCKLFIYRKALTKVGNFMNYSADSKLGKHNVETLLTEMYTL